MLKRRFIGLSISMLSAAVMTSLAACTSVAPSAAAAHSPQLIPVYSSNRIWNGITFTRTGHTFVSYPQAEGPGVQLAELDSAGHTRPIPDAAWNKPWTGQSTDASFVHINGLRAGPDGMLWAVDAGAPGLGKPAVAAGARLIEMDPSNGTVIRAYVLSKATKPYSYINDVRFNRNIAYLTDTGAAGLIVLNLETGDARRVLDGDPSTIDARPMYSDGKIMGDAQGHELRVDTDQLEVSPDGAWLYYQPSSGPMSRIATRWVNDPSVPAKALATHIEPWVDTPTTGGTAIDAQGNIYVGDTRYRRILKISPDRKVAVVLTDPRLISTDAMWIDDQGFLWIPATQQSLTAGVNQGKTAVHYPIWMYKVQIHAKPSPLDHS